MRNLHSRAGFFLLVPVVAIALGAPASGRIETVIVTGTRDPADPCLVIAGAKKAQWEQARLMIREGRKFADGSEKVSEVFFTVNAAYAHWVGKPWNTVQFLRPQRNLGPADSAAQRMQLADCQLLTTAVEADQSARLYTFSYLPDAQGRQSSGRIWIAVSSGLPLRQEMAIPTDPSDPQALVQITADYAYGDDVRIPSAAQFAEYDRRARVQQWVRNLQAGRPQ